MRTITATFAPLPRPMGTSVIGETILFDDPRSGSVELLPVLRFDFNGVERVWDGRACRPLPRYWRDDPGSVSYPAS